jgi:hypothetical protein
MFPEKKKTQNQSITLIQILIKKITFRGQYENNYEFALNLELINHLQYSIDYSSVRLPEGNMIISG